MPEGYGPYYGDQQALLTQNRAAYGDYPAAMLSGLNTVGGGAMMGTQNLFTALGSQVMPVTYMPPARVDVGFHGMYQQQMGFFRGMFGMMGLESVPRGTTHMQHALYSAGDFGERAGAGAAGAASAAAALALGATVGRVGGAMVGGAVGSLLGPMGTAVGSFVGREAGTLVSFAAANTAMGQAIGQRRDIQAFLEAESFRFVGAGSELSDPRLGGGMSREARRSAAEFIRKRDVADPLMNTEELTQILQGSTRLGLFAGTHDTEDFQRKFKDIVENVKTVTKVLHQTLEEGLKTIKDLKGIGIDPSNVKSVVMQADMAGKVAGKTGAEMISLGLQGAELFRGTGVSMGIGFQANMMNMAAVRAARDAGMISTEAIAQLGGEEAAAQRMTASGLMFGQTAFGRGMGGAFFNAGMGPAGFNQASFMQSMMQGGGNFVQMAQQAAVNLGSPANLIQYQANQEKFMTEIGKTFGGQGLQMFQAGAAMSQAQFLSQTTGANLEDSFRLSLKQMGLSAPEVEARVGMIRSADAGFAANQQAAATTRDQMLMEEAAQNFIAFRAADKIKDLGKSGVDLVARPLSKVIDNAAESAIRFREEQMFGMIRGSSRGIDFSVLPANIDATGAGVLNLDMGGAFATTAGEKILKEIKKGAFASIGVGAKAISENPEVILSQGMGGSRGVSREQLENIRERASVMTVSLSEAERMQAAGALEEIDGNLGAALARGQLGSGASTDEIVSAVFGKKTTLKNVSRQQMAKLLVQAKGTVFEGTLRGTRESFMVGENAAKSMETAALRKLRDQFDQQKTIMAKQTEIGEFAGGVAERLAAAVHVESSDPERAERLRAEAAQLQAETGASAEDVSRMIQRSKNFLPNQAKEFLETAAGIRAVQMERGNATLADSIEAQLRTDQFDLLSAGDREAGLKAADEIRTLGLGAMSDASAATLERLKVGSGIVAQRTKLLGISERLPEIKKKQDRAQARTLLSNAGLRGKILDDAVQDAIKGDASKVIQAVERETTMRVAGDSGVMGGSGKPAEAGGETAGAMQQFAMQTSINTQVLSALQGLSAKLGVR